MFSRPGQAPIGPTVTYRGVALRPIRGGESRPGETPVPATPPAPAEPPAATPPAPTGDEHDPARARALIEKLRPFETEAKRLAKERDDLAAKLQAHEDEKLGTTEKLTKQVNDLTAKLADAETHRERADRYEAALKSHLDELRRDLPKHLIDLLDGRDVADQLAWLSKNRAEVVGSGRPGVPATPRPTPTTPAQRIDDLKKGYALPRL